MRTRELISIANRPDQGFDSLFAKAHSADWDFERDVDWSIPVTADDPLVELDWTAFGQTTTFRALPDKVKGYVNRRGLGRMLNILMVGEAVAQNVCAKLVLKTMRDQYRNHAAAQAMDEARHHLAYRRFTDRMQEQLEEIDAGSEMMFDMVLQLEDPLELIASEQFFLESLAMNIFEGIERQATNPLLKRILHLITRDESRHMGFGILYISEWMQTHSLDERIGFAARWLPQILGVLGDRPGPIMLARLIQRMKQAGVENADEMAPDILREQRLINATDIAKMASGENVPQLLKSARRAGLLAPEILDALGYGQHPLVRGALTRPEPNQPLQ